MNELITAIKTSFMVGFASADITLLTAAVCFGWALVISIYIFAIYRILKKNAFYNKSYGMSLIVLSLVVASIILVIQSNIVISLGMVGALSIVRYRTAIKDPLDLVFFFWTISVGIICGAGFAGIALLASAITTVVILCFDRAATFVTPKVLVINGSTFSEDEVMTILKECCTHFEVRAQTMNTDRFDMAIEVKSKQEQELLSRMMNLPGMDSASLVTHSGDVTV